MRIANKSKSHIWNENDLCICCQLCCFSSLSFFCRCCFHINALAALRMHNMLKISSHWTGERFSTMTKWTIASREWRTKKSLVQKLRKKKKKWFLCKTQQNWTCCFNTKKKSQQSKMQICVSAERERKMLMRSAHFNAAIFVNFDSRKVANKWKYSYDNEQQKKNNVKPANLTRKYFHNSIWIKSNHYVLASASIVKCALDNNQFSHCLFNLFLS